MSDTQDTPSIEKGSAGHVLVVAPTPFFSDRGCHVRIIEEIRAAEREGYRATLNTDNRLMSGVTMTDEFRVAHETFGCGLADLERVTVNAMNAAFHPYAERHRIIDERIAPEYRALAAKVEDGA